MEDICSLLNFRTLKLIVGPLLFFIILNMDDNITSNVLKFADDTNVLRKVNNDGDKQHLQNDLYPLIRILLKYVLSMS